MFHEYMPRDIEWIFRKQANTVGYRIAYLQDIISY